jgi:transposase
MSQKHYPAEYRQRMVNLVRAGRQVPELAREFKIPPQTIYRWVHQARVDDGEREGFTSDEKAELSKLRREVAELREEREILKKFAAWSAREASSTPGRRSRS